MAEAMVLLAIERLGDQFIVDGKLLYGSVRDHLVEIEDELRRMQPLLKDADARQYEDRRLRTYVAEIEDLAYRIRDKLEAFGLHVLTSRRGIRGIRNLPRRFACLLCEGTSCLQTYGLRSLAEDDAQLQQLMRKSYPHLIDEQLMRKSYPHLLDEDLVGREKDEEKLISLLLSNNKESGTVSIVGEDGLGKTTMARRIYNSINVRRSFERRAWAYVGQQFETTKVLQDILTELLPKKKDEITRMRDTELVNHLYKVQQEKKYLVVLDDLRSINIWESIKPAFPIGCTVGSKVLITISRNTKVGSVGSIHRLRFLNEEEGWELFKRKAFAKGETTSSGLGRNFS